MVALCVGVYQFKNYFFSIFIYFMGVLFRQYFLV